MKILLVNDDGVFAPGINALAAALKKKHEIVMCAPSEQRSGYSQSLTYLTPFTVKKVSVEGNEDVEAYALDGTPADCAKFGIRKIFDWKLDLVVSGINDGMNIGTDIYYSGTIGGATEAAMFGIPAIAVSQNHSREMNFAYAAEYCADFIDNADFSSLPNQTVVNINFPVDPEKNAVGSMITRQGVLDYNEYYPELGEQDGKQQFRLRGDLKLEAEEGTDFYALLNNYISVTAFKYDRTDYSCEKMLKNIVK